MGEEWRNLDDERKAVFEMKAEAERERYAREKAAYALDQAEDPNCGMTPIEV